MVLWRISTVGSILCEVYITRSALYTEPAKSEAETRVKVCKWQVEDPTSLVVPAGTERAEKSELTYHAQTRSEVSTLNTERIVEDPTFG